MTETEAENWDLSVTFVNFLISFLFVVIVLLLVLLLVLLFIYLFVQVVIPLIQESEWIHLPLMKETCAGKKRTLLFRSQLYPS